MLVYECARNNVKMLIVLMVFYRTHPISGVPLNQHRQLSCFRMLMENFSPGAWPKVLPLGIATIHVGDEFFCHDNTPSQ
jgi:hypothetical protein